jgi:hypothetical protein
MLESVLTLCHLNRLNPVRFVRNDPWLRELFNECPSKCRELKQLLGRLHAFSQRNNVAFGRNNPFIRKLGELAKQEKAKADLKEEKEEESIKLEIEEKEAVSTNANANAKPKCAAVCIGINYKGTANELRGCENDIINTKKVLKEKFGFEEANINTLMESEGTKPTFQNILKAIDWLIQKNQREGVKELWFQYSGHGSHLRDRSGDEKDGQDECLVTMDNYALTDDLLRSELISKLTPGTKLYCLMDCCHSGTIMDLKYKHRQGRNMVENPKIPNHKLSKGQVIAISGCKDNQTSADAWFRTAWSGALTKSILAAWKETNYKPTCDQFLNKVQQKLRAGRFSQISELTCEHPIDNKEIFGFGV